MTSSFLWLIRWRIKKPATLCGGNTMAKLHWTGVVKKIIIFFYVFFNSHKELKMQNKPPVIFKNHIDLQVFDSHFLAILLDNIKKIKSQNTKPPDWPFWKQRKANFFFACGSLNEIFL